MNAASLISLATALIVFAAVPGPGVTSVVSYALGRGFIPAAALVLGLVCGDLAYMALAMFGLDLIAKALGGLFMIVKVAGAAYLIWIGIALWRAPPTLAATSAAGAKGLGRTALTGLAISLANPKVIAFYLGLIPAFITIGHLTLANEIVIVGMVASLVGGVLLVYAWLAVTARHFLNNPRRVRLLNRTAATTMIGSGVALTLN